MATENPLKKALEQEIAVLAGGLAGSFFDPAQFLCPSSTLDFGGVGVTITPCGSRGTGKEQVFTMQFWSKRFGTSVFQGLVVEVVKPALFEQPQEFCVVAKGSVAGSGAVELSVKERVIGFRLPIAEKLHFEYRPGLGGELIEVCNRIGDVVISRNISESTVGGVQLEMSSFEIEGDESHVKLLVNMITESCLDFHAINEVVLTCIHLASGESHKVILKHLNTYRLVCEESIVPRGLVRWEFTSYSENS